MSPDLSTSLHREHEVLVGRPRPHDIGFRRIGIGCPRIAHHRLCGGTDDHDVRARLNPMIIRLGFGCPRVRIARPGVAVEHINKADLIGRWCMGLPRLRPLYGVGVHARRGAEPANGPTTDRRREIVRERGSPHGLCGSGRSAPSAWPRGGHAKKTDKMLLLVWTAPDGIKRARMRSL